MTNKFLPHVYILPEDDANRQMVNGFLLNPNLNINVIKHLPTAGGWVKVVDSFKDVHIVEMRRFLERRMVLIIDFGNSLERLDYIKGQIPDDLRDRVFILGVLSEPEELKAGMNYRGLEDIGKSLSQDCVENTQRVWGHKMLAHNKAELERLISLVKPFLFTLF
jgi:hypothetical protein